MVQLLQGAYNITITAQTAANVQLLCLQVDFTIKPPVPPPAVEMEIESEEAAEQVQEVQAGRMKHVQIS